MIFLRMLALPVLLAWLLFLPAGTWDFWQAWAYLICYCASAAGFVVFFHYRDPQLLARRLLRKEKTGQQKIILLLLKLNFAAVTMLCALDHRLGWTRQWLAPVPAWGSWLALGLIIGCQVLFVWVMDTNRFASAIIQVEDNQKIVDTGPYHYVRHPMYAVGIVQSFLTPLALGSLAVWPMFLVVIPVLAWRLLNEESLLRENLPGYREYCQRTRYRLVPGVW